MKAILDFLILWGSAMWDSVLRILKYAEKFYGLVVGLLVVYLTLCVKGIQILLTVTSDIAGTVAGWADGMDGSQAVSDFTAAFSQGMAFCNSFLPLDELSAVFAVWIAMLAMAYTIRGVIWLLLLIKP